MGMSASQARLLELQNRKPDMEFAAQFVENQKLHLAREATQLSQKERINDSPTNKIEDKAEISKEAVALCKQTSLADAKPQVNTNTKVNPMVKKALSAYAKNTGIISTKEKYIDTNISNLENEKQQIVTELGAVEQVINNNIEETFETFSS